MKGLWSRRFLRPWLFRRWERRRRRALESLVARGLAGPPLTAGMAAPETVLPDEQGNARRLDEWLGPSGAVVWFTNLCDVCADQAEELAAARRRGEIRESIVAIHLPGLSSPPVSEFRRRAGERLPILIDDGAVSRAWTGEAVPDT